IYGDFATEKKALGWTPEQIRNGWNQYLSSQAGARVTGAGVAHEGLPIPLGKEKDMARLTPEGEIQMAPSGSSPAQLRQSGFRSVEEKVLDSINALKPAETALQEFKTQAEQLAKESEGMMGSLSNVAGASGGLKGAVAQRLGASNTGDNLKAATLNFMQHYDRVVGGLRGASSPQLLQIMEQRAPQPGMTPTQIRNR